MATSHAHTFELTLFIEVKKENFYLYDEIESVVYDCLMPYEYKELEEVEPFDQIEATLENMGNVFFSKLDIALEAFSFHLIKLEISETPSRVYIVSPYDKRLDNEETKRLLIENILTRASNAVMEDALNTNQILKNTPSSNQSEIKRKIKNDEEKDNRPYNQTDDAESNINNNTEASISNSTEENIDSNAEVNNKNNAGININDNTEVSNKNDTHTGVNKSKHHSSNLVIKALSAVLFLATLASFLLSYIKQIEGAPWGADIYGHIFKGDLVYQGIKQGNIYPLFTEFWYNGVQPFRYWGPIPYYIFAGCEALAKGDVYEGYYLFIAVTFFIGAIGWLLWGIKNNRIFLSLILGILWFFMPDNLRVFFSEGNIPRIVITATFPYFLFFLWAFVEDRQKKAALGVVLVFSISILSHLMIAAMIGIATFIFLLCYGLICKKIRGSIQIITMMLMAFLICGIWVYPALKGGLVSMDKEATSEVMRQLSVPFTISLNPFLRLKNTGYFYYGLSILLISVIGVIASYKKSQPGFITTLIIFLGTTTAFIPFLIKLPLNQLLWMMRFTPMAYGFFLMAIFNWKRCKKLVLASILLLLILDSSLSFNLPYYTDEKPKKITQVLDEAKRITKQRILLLDNSLFGSYPSYYLGSEGKRVPYAYGWAWQGAATAKNIVLLNTAVERGYYNYMFDRAIEMGCDTLIIRKASLMHTKDKWKDLRKSAQLSGYSLYKETPESYIIHRDIEHEFGVVTDYEGLCIGRFAADIPLLYPYFEHGDSWNIEDYSLTELSQYKVIFLSDFNYYSRENAENILTWLSEKGVKIIIDMNRIPADTETNRMKFLGVHAQPITFYKEFGDLFFNGKTYNSKGFIKQYEAWNTVYLDNLDEITGFLWMNNQKLAFAGKKEYDNITFLGFNLMFHAMTNEDEVVKRLLSQVIGVEEFWLPKRELALVDIQHKNNAINIFSTKDHVNTTLAFLDAYKSTDLVWKRNNLLHVNKGETKIKIIYPYLLEGIVISLMGMIVFTIVFTAIDKRRDD